MNASERFTVPENVSSVEQAALFEFRDGFEQVKKFAEQKAAGADVGAELEELREALFNRLAKTMEDLQAEGEGKGRQGELLN